MTAELEVEETELKELKIQKKILMFVDVREQWFKISTEAKITDPK